MKVSLKRILALMIKEFHQISRDPGNIGISVVLPAILLILFGYGMSMDVKNIKIAFHSPAPSQLTESLAGRFMLSPYFTFHRTTSWQEAELLLRQQKVNAIISVQSDFDSRVLNDDGKVQLILNGVESNQARLISNYVQGVFSAWIAGETGYSPGLVNIQYRARYNAEANSHYYLVPGVIVIIMTIIGAMLTALVMAREYERGTLESLFTTPVTSGEILIAKSATNFLLGMVSLTISICFALFVFQVPLRGSLPVLLGVSSLYLTVAMGLGLVISTASKNQFIACQLALLGTFLPAMMLSGFLFDIMSMPAVIRAFTWLVPAKYYVSLMQTIFLAGDIPSVILPAAGVLALFAIVLMTIARLKTPKTLDT